MRFYVTWDKYNNRYTTVQIFVGEERKFKHYDFLIIDEQYVMSPITGELVQRNRQAIIEHILQYPHTAPVNREV